ncbi:MAG: hypothetical protein ACRDJ2_10770 [Actinomycetota bacterium]
MSSTYRITQHAIERYQGRVDATVSRAEARELLADLASRSKVRPTPRHWMRHTVRRPGSRYLYCADRHDICLVVAGDSVVTVYSRWVCRRWRRLDLLERSVNHATIKLAA